MRFNGGVAEIDPARPDFSINFLGGLPAHVDKSDDDDDLDHDAQLMITMMMPSRCSTRDNDDDANDHDVGPVIMMMPPTITMPDYDNDDDGEDHDVQPVIMMMPPTITMLDYDNDDDGEDHGRRKLRILIVGRYNDDDAARLIAGPICMAMAFVSIQAPSPGR